MADPELSDWCKRNGVVFNGISAAYVPEGWRGIVATKDLQPGDVVLQVPERLLLTSRSATRDPVLTTALQRHWQRGGSELGPHQLLGCHLLAEVARGPASFWWPYLRQLPRNYTSLANFSTEDAAALQLPHARDAAVAAAERARAEWRGALPVLLELDLPKRFTCLRAWLWATCTLHSRTMYLPWCSAGALTPYGDLHNYQPPAAPYTPQLGGPAAAAAATPATPGRLEGGPRPASVGAVVASRPGDWVAEAASVYPPGDGAAGSAVSGAAGIGLAANGSAGAGSLLVAGAMGSAATPTARGAVEQSSGPRAGSSGGGDGSCGGGEDQADGSGQGDGRGAVGGDGLRPESAVAGRGGNSHGGDRTGDGGGGGDGGAAAAATACHQSADTARATAMVADYGDAGEEDSAPVAGDGMWDEAAQQYCIVVRRPYRRGEQVMLCYGRYSNLELLEHYGFVLENNPHDTAQLDPELLPVPAAARAAASAAALPYLAPTDCFLHANGQPSWQLLHWLRYAAASSAERRRCSHLMAAGERASEQADRQALRWLYTACSLQLSGLPTSPQDDLQLLDQQQGKLHSRPKASQTAPPAVDLTDTGGAEQPGSSGSKAATTREEDCSRSRTAADAAATDAPAAAGVAGAAGGPGAVLSDGLTCAGLALQWRTQQKQILMRMMRRAEEALGAEAGACAGFRGPVVERDLAALVRQQRQRPPPGSAG